MQKIAQFEMVSEEQFLKDFAKIFPESAISDGSVLYKNIKLPKRATSGSAGYDIYALYGFTLQPGETRLMPTGIRCKMEEGWVLQIYPRSGLGFNYRLQLNNTVGIIDSDYYGSNNEGHIFIKVTNDTNEKKILRINRGDAFCQGIFVPFGITVDDDADGIRNGGFGSTGK
ncbi:MAG: dUTP diphosphatase [Lachnospiraceae bacterium]|nr:dUTP diphosphatase [Lachnospiraceae bacterium]